MDNPFQDLIPQTGTSPAENPFSDLIPSENPFADLLPAKPPRSPEQVALKRASLERERDLLREQDQQIAEQEQFSGDKAALRAALGAGGQAGGIMEEQAGALIASPLLEALTPGARILNELTGGRIKQAGRKMLARGRRRQEEYKELGENVGGGPLAETAQTLGATASASAPVIPAALLGGLPLAAATAGVQQFGSTFAEARQHYLNETKDEKKAEQRAMLPAVLSGLTTAAITAAFGGQAAGLEGVTLQTLKAAGTRSIVDSVRRIILNAGGEGAEELSDQVAQSVIAKWSYRPELSVRQGVAESLMSAGAGVILGGGANVIVEGAGKAEKKADDLFAEFREDKDFAERSKVAAQRTAQLLSDPAFQADPRFDAMRQRVEKEITPPIVEHTKASRRMAAQTLATRGVDAEVAEQFADHIGGKLPRENAEAYAARVLTAFREAGGRTAEDNPLSSEANLRGAAEANQFTEEQIQETLAKRSARDAEIAASNQRLIASLPKDANVQIEGTNAEALRSEAPIGPAVGQEVRSPEEPPRTGQVEAPRIEAPPTVQGQAITLPSPEDVSPTRAPLELQEKRQKMVEGADMNPMGFEALELAIARANGKWNIDATAEAVRHASHGIPARQYLEDVAKSDDPTAKAVVERAKQILEAWPVKPVTQGLLDTLEGLKIETRGAVHAFGIVPLTWNAAIDVAMTAVRAGSAVAEAVESAITWIKEQYSGQWDEAGAREALTKAMSEPGAGQGIRTQIMGGEHYVRAREGLTPESRAESISFAEQVFRDAGVEVLLKQEVDGRRNMVINWFEFQDTGTQQNEAGRRLAERLRQEIATQNEPGKHPEHLANLINSIRLNFERGNMDAIFERSIREELYSVAQGEASNRGARLGALAQHSVDLTFISRNVDLALTRVYSEAFGGDAIESLARRVDALVRADPNKESSPKGTRKRAVKQAREQATTREKEVIGTKRRRWNKIAKGLEDGKPVGDILRDIAKEEGWPVANEAEIAKMKALAAEEERLRTLTPKEKAEAKSFGDEAATIREKEAATLSERTALKKEMHARWARLSKPVRFWPVPLSTWWAQRQNLAAAGNELAAANLLTRISFAPRQAISVLTQALVHLPTRAIAAAVVQRHDSIARGDPVAWSELWGDISEAITLSIKAQANAIRPSLLKARAAFKGRVQAKNIDSLMTGMQALDRIDLKVKELRSQGKQAQAAALALVAQIRWGYRIAQSLDYLQGTPAEAQEVILQVNRALMEDGKTKAERALITDFVIGSASREWGEAIATAHRIREANGLPVTPEILQETAAELVKRWQFERVRELGLPADEFQEQAEVLRNTIGWNEAETSGPGGLLAAAGKGVQKIVAGTGMPIPLGLFANAIGTTVNRALHFSPFYWLANINLPGGNADGSPWMKTEIDRQQRKLEAILGTGIGTSLMLLSAMGIIVVHTRPPKDKEERDLWERQGHKANTVELLLGDGSFIPISLNTGPMAMVAPYLAAGGALHGLMTEREKAQAKMDAEAAAKGLPPGEIRPVNLGDLMGVAGAAFYGAVVGGGRTVSGLVGSMTEFGDFNATKFTSSLVSPNIPGLPAVQEISRMGGVVLDQKLASFGDFLLPLPTSGARKTNLIGEPAGTPNDVQRIIQILSGGSYPGLVDAEAAKSEAAYAALFASGYRPPSINPNKGYSIGGKFRPMDDEELQRYTQARGEGLREALSALGPTADIDQVRNAYQRANAAALRTVGVKVQESVPLAAAIAALSSQGGLSLGGAPALSRPRSSFRRGRSVRLRRGRRPRLSRGVRRSRRTGIRRLSRGLRTTTR